MHTQDYLRRQATRPLGRRCILCGRKAEAGSFLLFVSAVRPPLQLQICFACRDTFDTTEERAAAVVDAWNSRSGVVDAVLH